MKLRSGNKFSIIGAMSGTSCDGLDLAACEFIFSKGKWKYSIIAAETIGYNPAWIQKLQKSPTLSGVKLIELHAEYGRFIGTKINSFIKKTGFKPDFISSHGHTVFHRPEKHFTFQLGSGTDISATTKIITIADFRTGDVALGGQGAPLVPFGDKLLFSEFDNCLNLGGFANISCENKNVRIAYDICPVNFVLNLFAEKLGHPHDTNGDFGRQGKINEKLLNRLNNIHYYQQKPPKSLGREWIEEIFLPVLNSTDIPDSDKLRTLYEHISFQICKSIKSNGKVLATGGGTFNTFLIERIRNQTNSEIVLPESNLINFKEALIFAFLGVLKITGQINCLSSVTGASRDSICGTIFNF